MLGLIIFKLKELLIKQNISERQLSRYTNIRPNTINAYCRGIAKRMEVHDLDKICKALNCQISDIIEYKGELE